MRRLLWITLLISPAWALEGLPSLNSPLTVVVDSEQPIAAASLQEMQRELSKLLKQADRPLEWRLRSEMKLGDSAADIVLVRFQGDCRMTAFPQLLDERGPLAFAHTVDNDVLPFGVVRCDQVRSAARSAMHGAQFAQGDKLMGRAMARVVAHEIWHMTSNSKEHAKSGIARHSLSGAALIAEDAKFDELNARQLAGPLRR